MSSKRGRDKWMGASAKLKRASTTAKRHNAGNPIYPSSMSIRRNPNSVAQETHYVDVLKTTTPMITAGTFVCLNALKEGNAAFQRNGRRIVMKSLHLNGIITPNASAPGSTVSKYARIIVFYDKQANGAAPSLATLLYSDSNTSTLHASLV